MKHRHRIQRRVLSPPRIKGFKPFGQEIGMLAKETVSMLFEEYEALRLCDYETLNHQQASDLMGVSRPTFTRIYASALRKIAKAFVEGSTISIEGGKVYFDSDWYQCKSCNCKFNNPEKNIEILCCPLCASKDYSRCESSEDKGLNEELVPVTNENCDDLCYCIACNYEVEHKIGNPCSKEICPVCGQRMRRKPKNNRKSKNK